MTVIDLANSIEASGHYTRGHCERVRKISIEVAMALGVGVEELEVLEYAAVLHDIGKIGISAEVLNKPALVILQHHERVDGGGYPEGLMGDEIHLLAKILSVADAFDAMTSARPYRKQPLSQQAAVDELVSNIDVFYERNVVETMIAILDTKYGEEV